MAVGLVHFYACLDDKVVLESNQEGRVEFGGGLCEMGFAEDIGVHVTFVVGEGTNEE